MTSFPAVDVAIGLSFAYLLLSVLSTGITETISRFTKMRARTLENWLQAVLRDPDKSVDRYEDFLKTPIITALMKSVGRPVDDPTKKAHPPAYIPSPHFVAAALSAGRTATTTATGAAAAWTAIGDDIRRLHGTSVGDSLQEFYDRAGGDVVRFRQDAEAWFDDHMERVSGLYRRWSQRIVWITAAVLVVVLNANSFRIAQTLWNDPSKRAAIVAKAGTPASSQNPNDAINDLTLPIGWSNGYHSWGWAWMVVGMLITLGAVSLGAPFWFDVLSRFSRIRQTGTPPPASNATRGGEGDQSRTLPSLSDWKPAPEGGDGSNGSGSAQGQAPSAEAASAG
jgi:hypothetical protein